MAGERILIVEDNQLNMKLFRDVLEATGFRTLEASSGALAVELATQHRPDLVLLDIRLPDIDGVEALARLRSDARTAAIPVVALTAQAMGGDRERFLADGFDGYVSKPVDVGVLVATVSAHLGELGWKGVQEQGGEEGGRARLRARAAATRAVPDREVARAARR